AVLRIASARFECAVDCMRNRADRHQRTARVAIALGPIRIELEQRLVGVGCFLVAAAITEQPRAKVEYFRIAAGQAECPAASLQRRLHTEKPRRFDGGCFYSAQAAATWLRNSAVRAGGASRVPATRTAWQLSAAALPATARRPQSARSSIGSWRQRSGRRYVCARSCAARSAALPRGRVPARRQRPMARRIGK